jgi:hypothetical protein
MSNVFVTIKICYVYVHWCDISCATRPLSAILQTSVLAFSYGQFMTYIAFSMNYSIHLYVCNIDTLAWNFNGMIKWYEFRAPPCIYIYIYMCICIVVSKCNEFCRCVVRYYASAPCVIINHIAPYLTSCCVLFILCNE